MKTMRARLTVTFVFLMVAMVAIVWGVNQWYLERFYISQKVDTIEEAYEVIKDRKGKMINGVFVKEEDL